MKGKTLAIFIGSLLVAAVIGWHLAFFDPTKGPPAISEASGQVSAGKGPSTASTPGTPAPPGAWVPPTGDPVERYHQAKTSEERMKIISDFITLGHNHTVLLLQEAVKDSDPKVRMLALESAASMLTPELAREVYRVSGRSDDPDIRTMTWSFLAPHPMENRVAVYGEVLQKGPDVAVEEAISEMGRTPEMSLFDTLLFQSMASDMKPERTGRLLKELNDWLKPGGGNVPAFKSVAELQTWWQANRRRYDTFMLRVDL